jgi:hypothetical protein
LRKAQIAILFFCIIGCRPTHFVSPNPPASDNGSIEKIIENIKNRNISANNFFIEKADFSIKMNKVRKRYQFSVKFKKPDQYLLSIRNSTGLEGARIYFSKDTVLINDRIRKKIISGNKLDLARMIKLPKQILNIAFGDILSGEDSSKIETKKVNDQIEIYQLLERTQVKYILDIREGKMICAIFKDEDTKESFTVNYSKFGKSENRIPEYIELKSQERDFVVKMRIEKISVPWKGEIDFIPGKGYTKEIIK